ncbi:MAG: RHS repeat-associated core domain-containing protein, partial [Terracidiphilus sp.]
TYDQSGHGSGIGRLTWVSDAAGTLSRSYDQLGNLLTDARTTSAAGLTTGYTYDAANRIASITYPSGVAVNYTRDTMGRITAVAVQPSGGTSTPVASSVSYEPFGPDTGFKYGSGSSETRGFDQDYRMTNVTDLGEIRRGEARVLENLSYAYYPTNYVQTITDAVTSGNSQSFSYDNLLRLSQATGSYGSLGYTYDGDGNQLTQALGATSTSYGYGTGSDQLATISVGGVTTQAIGYSTDGRIASLNPGIQAPAGQYITSLSYNQDAQLSAVNAGSGALASYSYDGNGMRVVKSTWGGATTVSIFSGSSVIAEYDNGAPPSSPSREYIAGPTGLLAMISDGTTTYFHQDDKSVRLTTDANGNVLTQEGHFPFGEPWYQSGTTNQWFFTSYDRDSESGLDYALARYYNSRTGTFCSADPLAGDPGDPQSWNRYPYGRNDPIDITDPSGKSWWSDLLIGIGVGVTVALLPEIAPAWFGAGTAGATVGTTQGLMFSDTGAFLGATQGAVYTWGSSTLSTAIIGGSLGAVGTEAFNPPQTPAAPTTPQTPKKNCPPVPAHPKSADVDANIRSTEAANAADQTPGKATAKAWWVNQVWTNHAWDYKTQSQAYDDFGNFNYGATGAVFNYSLSTLEQGAAAARFMKSPLTQLKKYGLGNDPHKNDMIRQGMQYKQNDCGHF